MANLPPLICTYFTLAGAIGPFDASTVSPIALGQRARAAASAGYTGLGFNSQDIAHLLDTLGAAQINTILDDHGLVDNELEVLLDWFVDGKRRRASDRDRQLLLRAAEAIGARQVKVGGDLTGKTWPMDSLIEEFAFLCDQAARAGTAVTIELFPSSNLADLQTGRAVVEGAGRKNGGLLLDIWHMVRGNINMEAVASLPDGLINHVELNDGTLLPRADYLTDTIENRLVPGEGEFPLGAFLQAIAATGYRGAYGVEILSATFRSLPAEQAARRSYDAAAALFDTVPSGR
jgi:sugar phosphate isomerase/epimerase